MHFVLSSTHCDSSNDYLTKVDFAGIHGSVRLYSTPEVHVADITYVTYHNYNKATIKFMTEVGASDNVNKNGIFMSYELLDREGRVAAFGSGAKMFSGEMTVFNPTLWWPIGMSDTPGYLYTLKVNLISRRICTLTILDFRFFWSCVFSGLEATALFNMLNFIFHFHPSCGGNETLRF